MAIVNRTRDSFYDGGATFDVDKAMDRVHLVVGQGAGMIDIGGVKAGPGQRVDAAEEIERTVPLVAQVREAYPDLAISVDTWRAEVAGEVLAVGADVINDAWGCYDPEILTAVAEADASYICTHSNGATPRQPPHRVSYPDVVASAIGGTVRLAERAVAAGIAPDALLIDPAHDFEKNTFHSLEITRRLDEMVATGWPVLVSLSNKDFVGETLGLPKQERLTGTLAATSIAAWHGARVFRVHEVAQTRQTLDMVLSIQGLRPPHQAVRALS